MLIVNQATKFIEESVEKKKPFYKIVVADQRRALNGRNIERIGFYNPMAKPNEQKLKLDLQRVQYWVGQGAKPSDRVAGLIKQAEAAS